MNKKELQQIISEGEGYQIEFKESFSNLDRELIAFSNSSGGRVFVGIKDNGEISGIQKFNRCKAEIEDIAKNCDPSIFKRNFIIKPESQPESQPESSIENKILKIMNKTEGISEGIKLLVKAIKKTPGKRIPLNSGEIRTISNKKSFGGRLAEGLLHLGSLMFGY